MLRIKWLSIVTLACTFVFAACRSSDVANDGFGTSPDTRSDRPAGDAPELTADPSCPPRPAAAPSAAKELAIFPAPRKVTMGTLGATAKTACVDTSALAKHDRLDAKIAALVTAAGLEPAPLGCSCDYTMTFAPQPALDADGAAELASFGDAPERHVVVARDSGDGRTRASLFAASERGALYALETALALAQKVDAGDVRVASATIIDAPAFVKRGVVEGIYGPQRYCDAATMHYLPYRVADRSALLTLMAKTRENTFLYGPKCDPYARAQWFDPYPAGSSDEAVLRVALHEADERLLDFVWSISPGESFDFASPANDLVRLRAKLDSVYALGVRHFALFLDDIPDHSADPQIRLVLAMEDWLTKKIPGEHLTIVGTTYCSSPTNTFNCGGPNAYTNAFGARLPPEIEVLWTGASVEPSTMSAADMAGINTSLKRKVTVWDNWPNEPGGFHGRSSDLAGAVRGYYSNPVLNEFPGPAYPPSTFFAVLGPIADYLWSPERYVAGEKASFDRWKAMLATMGTGACAPCGANAPGWTCDGADPKSVFFCDYTTSCLTRHPCPGGCQTMPPGTPDVCR